MWGCIIIWKYVVKRLLQLVLILFGITLLSFALMQTASGDTVDAVSYTHLDVYKRQTQAAQSMASKTKDIPILVTAVTDPADSGLVESNEVPGGNVTGTSDLTPVSYTHLDVYKRQSLLLVSSLIIMVTTNSTWTGGGDFLDNIISCAIAFAVNFIVVIPLGVLYLSLIHI